MKYLIVSDIHGSKLFMDKIFKEFEKHSCHKMIILGDVLYHGPRNPIPEGYNPKELAEDINRFSEEIIAVRGNCDAEVDQMVLNVNIMNENSLIDINGLAVYLTHGHHINEDNLPEEKIDVLMNGHTHIPVLKKIEDVIYLNPGSITLPKHNNPKTFAVMDERSIRIIKLEDQEIFKELIL